MMNAKEPKNVGELRSLLGLVNFSAHFILYIYISQNVCDLAKLADVKLQCCL